MSKLLILSLWGQGPLIKKKKKSTDNVFLMELLLGKYGKI